MKGAITVTTVVTSRALVTAAVTQTSPIGNNAVNILTELHVWQAEC